jgi:hypothetical protein
MMRRKAQKFRKFSLRDSRIASRFFQSRSQHIY